MLMMGPLPRLRAVLRLAALVILIEVALGPVHHAVSLGPDDPVVLPAAVKVVATGIPGAGAICQVGTFHLGGPFPGKPAVQPGAILAPERLLVASTSNFGAPLARADQAPGSILSIDPRGRPVAVPADWAQPGPDGDPQVSIRRGRVRLYTANSPPFLNSFYNPEAVTANEPAVSGPLGISLNNAFGRPWFANAPFGSAETGTITVIDPDGRPFKGPMLAAGGVFRGNDTNRSPSSTHGLIAGALATSLITKSPDGSGRAVFFAALADGSVVQVHVEKGVDGLAPPGTFTPIPGVSPETAESTDPDAVVRVGMVFNWVPAPVAPKPVVYITDPLADRIVALELDNDGTLFSQTTRYITSPWLNRPVDIAGTSIETAARNFASNTVLGGGSDLYVLNRGDNTLVRLAQDGRIIASRSLDGVVPGMRVAGLAVSDDGRTLWVTATTPGRDGVILQMDAFGTSDVTASLLQSAANAGQDGATAQGAHFFAHELTVDEALGPLFNARACVSCHHSPTIGGMGLTPDSFVLRVGRVEDGAFHLVAGGPVARQHSIAELGEVCDLPTGIPPEANIVSRRSAMTLRGTSLIDTIRDERILAVMAAQPEDVRGRPHYMPDGRIGRFGWKAQSPTLVEFIAGAQRDQMGLTNPLAPRDHIDSCGANEISPEADGVPLTSLVAFLNTIDPPAPSPEVLDSPGAALFASLGCATCHTPSLPGPGSPAAAELPVRLYSDLLLHDMGPALDDGIMQGQATGREFRTMPLWRVSERAHFLHDGRATTITAAIQAHGGQAAAAAAAFETLSDLDKAALLEFLDGI
jgi:Di-haem oxidoreductase, putative peroxidase